MATPEEPAIEEIVHPPKSIILFSDGTGNSSGKLFKTNVWRMYEALDLGPATAGGRRGQIAYYDNGVGTSTIKPWAIVSGIFGFGLKRNVLSIYRFVCRNYQPPSKGIPGDRIYGFGFSRGAFTIRMVMALICSEGIIRYDTEKELRQRSLEALRRLSRRNDPNFFPYIVIAGRLVRDSIVAIKRLFVGAPPQTKPSHFPDIEFIGVWDTVAAYGGPIAEITRAIDNWIWPLSMPDYHLHPKVKRASHALALDDERDSFHPLLWDEFNESRQALANDQAATAAREAEAEARKAGDEATAARCQKEAKAAANKADHYRNRLKQVWFSGMHSDVGGGYPDESLSFVSLRWMMEQVSGELIFFPNAYRRIGEFANAFGPIHDSRSGLASYYRYQPRKITAFLHPESQPDDVAARSKARILRETLSLRDPTLGEQPIRPQGFLLSCKVHESVIARITSGADDYAPIVLPDRFEIVPAAPAEAPDTCLYDWDAWKNIEAKGEIDPKTSFSPRGDRQEAVWNEVLKRRLYYFATMASTVLLISLPMRIWGPTADINNRTLWGRLIGTIDRFLPELVDPWIRALHDRPWHVALLAILIFASRGLGAVYYGRINDQTRRLWCESMRPGALRPPDSSLLREWRNSFAYQRGLQWFKWWFLPNIVVGPLLLLSVLYALAVTVTQSKLTWDEFGACANLPMPADPNQFSTNRLCHRTGVSVSKDREYTVDFRIVDDWKDGGYAASPQGLQLSDVDNLPSRAVLAGGVPFRRVVTARYLEPLYEIRHRQGNVRTGISIGRMTIVKEGDIYRGTFRASQDGELFLFANDAVLPWDMDYFYTSKAGNNQGRAVITIVDQTAVMEAAEQQPMAPTGG